MASVVAFWVIAICVIVWRLAFKKHQKLPLPPGPPADPLIGHLRIFPKPQVMAETLYDWSLKYGDVFSIRVPGKTIIVLNSERAAHDLLEKRSAIYSDRVRIAYFDHVGWGDSIIYARYGPFHNQQRKMYGEAFGEHAVTEYRAVQEREANNLLKGLLDDPDDFDRLISKFAGGIVADIGYGHRIESYEDEFFDIGERFIACAGTTNTPTLLDLHPVFAYLPSWAPGAWYIDFMKETKPIMDAIVHDNYENVVQQMQDGTARPSFVANHLEAMYGKTHDPEQERALKLAAGMMLAAGLETTWHIVNIFISTMLLHPAVQEKAQKEIDLVVGRNRLPDLNDRESLPYLQCVINEVMRWQPVTPIGGPHQLTKDDTYNGMFLPSGSVVIANTRSMTWDENKFHEPQQFKPERFLPKPEGAGEAFSSNAIFGWGRRVCAGRYLAEGSFWTVAARILAVFTILPTRDAAGSRVMPEIRYRTLLTRHPERFTCEIRPRDERARKLVLDSCSD